MSWITVCWSAAMGACLFLALTHFFAWCHDRRAWACLNFSAMVLAVLGLGVCELLLMGERTPEGFSSLIRTGHLLFGVAVIASLAFVHLTFGTGKPWLFVLAVGLRMAAVAANYLTGSNLHFDEIRTLERVFFLGEEISIVGDAVANPWVRLGQLAALVQMAYVIDASLRLWRKGTPEARHQVAWVGGNITFFFLAATVYAGLVAGGVVRAPMLASFPFLGISLAIGIDMSRKVFRSARLAMDLEKSERRLALAASAARLAPWEWDLRSDRIWFSGEGGTVFGFVPGKEISFADFLMRVHEDDRESLEGAVRKAIADGESYEAEFRIVGLQGEVAWVASGGKVEQDDSGRSILFRGVSMDVTRRREAEQDAARQRFELAHLSRVGMLGELSGALAHELSQPLAAILSNAQVGSRLLRSAGPTNTSELPEILDDIVDDAKRAGGIVHGLRAMVRKDNPAPEELVALNEVVQQTLDLLHSELVARKTRVEFSPVPGLSPVRGGFVELQQVLVNLMLNSLDALKTANAGEVGRIRIDLGETAEQVRLDFSDNGPGISGEIQERLFEPFFSTKSGGYGLGLGLSISRTIIERFGGVLETIDAPDGRGAAFRILLPRADQSAPAPKPTPHREPACQTP